MTINVYAGGWRKWLLSAAMWLVGKHIITEATFTREEIARHAFRYGVISLEHMGEVVREENGLATTSNAKALS